MQCSQRNTDEAKKEQIQCEHCQYTWQTNSKLQQVTCPNCGKKTRGQTHEKEKESS